MATQAIMLIRRRMINVCTLILAGSIESQVDAASGGRNGRASARVIQRILVDGRAHTWAYLCSSGAGGGPSVGPAAGDGGSVAVPPTSNTNSIGGLSTLASVGPTVCGGRPTPAMNATYCFPSTMYVIGGAAPFRLVRISKSFSPLSAP